MKNLIIMLVLAVAIGGCRKSKADLDYDITGQVVNIVSGKPISNIRVVLTRTTVECLFCNIETEVLDSTVTDANGHFALDYPLKEGAGSYNFKLRVAIPPGFQFGVRMEGLDVPLGCLFSGVDASKDGNFYPIALMPIPYIKIVKPVVPAGWESDTLELSSSNLCFSYDPCYFSDTYFLSCMAFDSKIFALKDVSAWRDLEYPRQLDVGNKIRFSYTIRNRTVKKSGSFEAVCAFGDTTSFVLPLFE